MYAVLVGMADGDDAWRGVVMIVESIGPRPYDFQPPVYGSLIYTVTYMSDRLRVLTLFYTVIYLSPHPLRHLRVPFSIRDTCTPVRSGAS